MSLTGFRIYSPDSDDLRSRLSRIAAASSNILIFLALVIADISQTFKFIFCTPNETKVINPKDRAKTPARYEAERKTANHVGGRKPRCYNQGCNITSYQIKFDRAVYY